MGFDVCNVGHCKSILLYVQLVSLGLNDWELHCLYFWLCIYITIRFHSAQLAHNKQRIWDLFQFKFFKKLGHITSDFSIKIYTLVNNLYKTQIWVWRRLRLRIKSINPKEHGIQYQTFPNISNLTFLFLLSNFF